MVSAAIVVVGIGVATPATHAASIITDSQLAQQKAVLKESLISTMVEDVKYLQMSLIRLLEARIQELQAQQV